MATKVQSRGWQSDPEGRVRNISLSPTAKNSMFPLFEAVMNSIHAVEERFGRDALSSGQIDVSILRNEEGDCIGFIVTDNGVGFNSKNLLSFERMDSQTKREIGGKGVGRLLWLKVASSVRVQSVYEADGTARRIEFTFCLDHPTKDFVESAAPPGSKVGSTVELSPLFSEFVAVSPRKLSTIANRVLAHFISYFVNLSHPRITISDASGSIDLFDQFAESTERDQDYKFECEVGASKEKFVLHCFLLPKAISDDEKSTNALFLGANGRAVKRFDMDAVLGLKAIDGKFAFLGYVESEALDRSANDTRTDFSISEEEIDKIVDTAKDLAKSFLAPEIEKIRVKQVQTVLALRSEHPRFLSIARDAQEFAQSLHLSMQNEEEIYVELSRQSLRTYKRRRTAFNKSVKNKLPDIAEKAKAFVSGLQQESVSSLAEYVMKRKLILNVFEESLKYTDIDAEKSEYEQVLHEIICPLKSTADDLNYEDHNLWILDDRLAFFSYFNSDVQLKRQVNGSDGDTSRPDLSLFDLGLGFEVKDASQPVTIVEFKRPKRDNYTLDDNPITQVRKYVQKIKQAGEVVKYDGTPLRTVDSNTPFMCHIVADITESRKSVMRDLGPFHQKAGTGSYYRWDDAYGIFIEVSSFREVLTSAKLRNEAFFDKLGVN
jgi:hypothetical protein